MAEKRDQRFTVIVNDNVKQKIKEKVLEYDDNQNYHSNPMYEKLLNFRNLQESQKKKFSVDDLFKLC